MDGDQAAIAVPILNSYAHQYLRLPVDAVMVSGGLFKGQWHLIVATEDHAEMVDSFDAAKDMIDAIKTSQAEGG